MATFLRKWLDDARGHYWTVSPFARDRLSPVRPPPERAFRQVLADVEMGPLHVTGALHEVPDADTAVVVLHGVGGDITSYYMRHAAAAAVGAGMTSVRMNMRGADMSGSDFYHAGLTADLHAVMTSPALASYRRVMIIGYSLGGHIALRYALDGPDPRLAAVATICAPLDLARAARDIDQPSRSMYRGHILRSLKDMARASQARRALRTPLRDVMRIQHLRVWDDVLIAPRFRFADAQDYYARMSVARDLHALAIPTLMIATPRDPMVLPHAIEPALTHASEAVDFRWVDGGHVGFPPHLDLGENAPLGLEAQVAAWLRRQG